MSAGNRKNPYRPAPAPQKKEVSWDGYIAILCLLVVAGITIGMSLP